MTRKGKEVDKISRKRAKVCWQWVSVGQPRVLTDDIHTECSMTQEEGSVRGKQGGREAGSRIRWLEIQQR